MHMCFLFNIIIIMHVFLNKNVSVLQSILDQKVQIIKLLSFKTD